MVKLAFERAAACVGFGSVGGLATVAALMMPLVAAAQVQMPTSTGVGSQFELTFWQSVESGSDPALYEAYLAQYPTGTFAAVARVKLTRLRQSLPADPAPSPVPVAPTSPPPPQRIVAAPARQPEQEPAPAPPPPARTQLATANAAPAPARKVSEPAPYVTAAPPTELASDSADSAALRRLLGALGESQRSGAPMPAPIVETDAAAPDSGSLASPPQPAYTAAPSATPSRLVETTSALTTPAVGSPIALPDAAALSASTASPPDLRPIAVGPLPSSFALPPRPQLVVIPPLAFPASFCSAEARNAFHDGSYVAAVEAAKRNNDTTIAYMRQLQDLYDTNQLSGDINPMNAVAAEARVYRGVADAAFAAQSTLVSAFSTLMAVPITPCESPKRP